MVQGIEGLFESNLRDAVLSSDNKKFLIFPLNGISVRERDCRGVATGDRIENGVLVVPEPCQGSKALIAMAVMDLKFPWSIKFTEARDCPMPSFLKNDLFPHLVSSTEMNNDYSTPTIYTDGSISGYNLSLHCARPRVDPKYAAEIIRRYEQTEKIEKFEMNL